MSKNKASSAPHSIGIIMDGNRRFAEKTNCSVAEGHHAGFETLKKLIHWGGEAKIRTLYAYAFSTENWHRGPKEIFDLMTLLRNALLDKEVRESGVRVRVIGNRSRFSGDIQEGIANLERETAKNKKGTLVLALSYGGREEIVEATREIVRKKISPEKITEKMFSSALYTSEFRDPDLIIRTGAEGRETRLSNFLPWQSVYSELFSTKTLWPEFTKKEFFSILGEYEKCSRKNGK